MESLLPLILLMGIVWFLLLRPQQKRQKERALTLQSVEVGDDIITVGGLHGHVIRLDEESMDLEVTDDVVLRYQRDALMKIVRDEDEGRDDEALGSDEDLVDDFALADESEDDE